MAVVRNDANEYRLEHPGGGEWHLYCNDREVALTSAPQMRRDGGTVEVDIAPIDDSTGERRPGTTIDLHDDGTWAVSATFTASTNLTIPQQLSVSKEPKAPTLSGKPLELIQWWIGGKQYLNGKVLSD